MGLNNVNGPCLSENKEEEILILIKILEVLHISFSTSQSRSYQS